MRIELAKAQEWIEGEGAGFARFITRSERALHEYYIIDMSDINATVMFGMSDFVIRSISFSSSDIQTAINLEVVDEDGSIYRFKSMRAMITGGEGFDSYPVVLMHFAKDNT